MASFYNQSAGYPNSGQPPQNNTNIPSSGFYGMQQNAPVQQPSSPFYSQGQQQQQHGQKQQQHQQQQQQQHQHQKPAASSFVAPTQNSSTPNNNNVTIMPNLFNPAAAATAAALVSGNQDAMMKIGHSYFDSSLGHVQPGVGRFVGSLRVYFTVDNRYVTRKMQRILCPFFFKTWKRLELNPVMPPPNPDGSYNPSIVQYALPIMDENAPDLYIPCMSLITYVLLSAILYGQTGEFNPEVLPDVTSKCIITQILEVMLIRFGFYCMQVSTPILDLFSYTGYKYLGLCVNMLLGLLGLGMTGYYVGFLLTATSVSYFMLKVMSNSIPRQTSSTGPKREMMVVAFAGSQFATMWFVSQTKYLT